MADKNENTEEDIYIDRIGEPGAKEKYFIEQYGYISGAKSDIVGKIQEYREKPYFESKDQFVYGELIKLAEEKGYIGSEEASDLSSFMPKGGFYKPNDTNIRASAENYKAWNSDYELTADTVGELLETYSRGEVLSFINEAKNNPYGEYSEDEIALLEKAYNDMYGQYDDNYYSQSAADMSDAYMAAQAKRDAEEALGDFHYSRLGLIYAIGQAVDIDSKISTAKSLAGAITAPDKFTVDETNCWEDPLPSSYWSTYEKEIQTDIDSLKTLITQLKTDSGTIAETSSNINNDITDTAKQVAAVDPVFAQSLHNYFTVYAENMIKGLESGAISFDLAQFTKTIINFLDGDVNGLQISAEQTRLLQTVLTKGLSQIDYDNMSDAEKFFTECGVALVSFGEGFLNKVEGVVDGGFAIVGGVIAAPTYLVSMASDGIANILESTGYGDAADDFRAFAVGSKSFANGTIDTVRDIVGYDVSGKFFEIGTSGLNQYAVENSKTRKVANSLGGAAFDLLLGTYGEGAAVWINALSNTGKYAEKAANNEGMSNELFTATIAEAAFANFVFAEVGQYVKGMKPSTVSEYVQKASKATELSMFKSANGLYLDYVNDYTRSKGYFDPNYKYV